MTYYLCSYCNIFTFDSETGEPRGNLKSGIIKKDIPEDWKCPVCGKPKSYLNKINKNMFKEKKKLYDKIHPIENNTPLEEFRSIAREKLSGICAVNNVCDGNPERVCMGQKYGAPIGFGGAGQGRTFDANFRALEKYKFKMRVIGKKLDPEMETNFFGKKIPIPVLVSSVSGVSISMNDTISESEFQRGMIEGAKLFGTIGLSGNTVDHPDHPGVEIVHENNGWGIPIFKPQEQSKLLQLIKRAENANAIAVGVDLDGFGSTNWALKGKPVYRKSESDLKEIVDSTEKPIIFKGIMTLEDALKVVDSGAKAVDISNHGGRVLDYGQGVAEVLPEISKKLKGKIIIMADGAIRTGYDVLKLIALGADIALIGRPMARMSLAGGVKAVKTYLEYVQKELRLAMLMTGCDNINDVTDKILINND